MYKRKITKTILMIFLIATAILLPVIAAHAGFNQDTAYSFYEEKIVPYLLGGSILSFVGMVFLLIAGKHDSAAWGGKIMIALILAANSKDLVVSFWDAIT